MRKEHCFFNCENRDLTLPPFHFSMVDWQVNPYDKPKEMTKNQNFIQLGQNIVKKLDGDALLRKGRWNHQG